MIREVRREGEGERGGETTEEAGMAVTETDATGMRCDRNEMKISTTVRAEILIPLYHATSS